MGPWLVALVGVIYVSVAIDQAVKGNIPMCIVFLGYAASNVGFWHVSDIEAAGVDRGGAGRKDYRVGCGEPQ